MFSGLQFPFSRAMANGSLGEMIAGIAGVPGDLQQLVQKAIPRSGEAGPLTSLPTQAQIMQAQAQQTAIPPALNYSTLWSMLPELAMTLRGVTPPGASASEQPPMWRQNVLGFSKAIAEPAASDESQSGEGKIGRHPQAYK